MLLGFAAMNALEEAISVAGGLVGLAKRLGVTPQAIDQWRLRKIPAERVLAVELATGVSRHLLRPDIYPAD